MSKCDEKSRNRSRFIKTKENVTYHRVSKQDKYEKKNHFLTEKEKVLDRSRNRVIFFLYI